MKTADLVDGFDAKVHVCDLAFLRFGRMKSFWGPIATVYCFEDNALLRARLEEPGHGRVMVVDGGGSRRCALVGDQIASLLRTHGWSGALIYGAIRDSVEIDELEVGIFSIATTPKRSAKTGVGQCDVPVSFGSVRFVPGQYVYCDADGVLVSSEKLI
jgi:regulator of ribonuclease activity A